MTTTNFRIARLTANNFKRLRAIEITPDGALVEIRGKNGAGKSSVLDAIWAAFGGGRALPEEPTRRGAQKGDIEIDIGEFVIRRTFTKDGGGSLTVKTKEGSPITSPQAVLDKMYGALTFDPLQFTRETPARQIQMIRQVAGLDDAFQQIDNTRRTAEEARRVKGQEMASIEARLKALGPVVDGPDAEQSIADVMKRMQAATNKKAENDRVRGEHASVQRLLQKANENRSDLEQQLKKLDELIEDLTKQYNTLADEVCVLADPDIDSIQRESAQLDANNRIARHRATHSDLSAQLEQVRKQHAAEQRKIEDCDEKKREMMSKADIGVAGLEFDDDKFLLDGVPFAQASTSQKIRIGAALGFASKSQLRVMLVRDGSLLDSESKLALIEAAREHDAQLWIEEVGEGDKGVGFIIEDGSVVATPEKKAAGVA